MKAKERTSCRKCIYKYFDGHDDGMYACMCLQANVLQIACHLSTGKRHVYVN